MNQAGHHELEAVRLQPMEPLVGVSSWAWVLPKGSYPTPFLGYLVLWLGSVILNSRRPKKGVGYEPLGRVHLVGGVSFKGLGWVRGAGRLGSRVVWVLRSGV